MWLRRPAPFVVAAVVTVLVGLVLAQLDHVERLRQQGAARVDIGRQLDDIRSRLEKTLTSAILSTRGVAAEIAAHGDITPSVFSRVAATMVDGYPAVRNLTLARGTTIAMVYPNGRDDSVVGVDYRSQPLQWPMIAKAIETRTTLLQGPVTLIQGGEAMMVRTPVLLPGTNGAGPRLFGLVSAIINIPVVLHEAGLDRDDLPIKVAIRGRDGLGAAGEVFFGDPALFAEDPVEADVSLPYGSWRMAAVPILGWESDGEKTPLRMLAFLLLMLVATAAFGTAHHLVSTEEGNRALLEREAALAEATGELRRSNAELQQFAYVASHDLREPLRMVSAYVTLLEQRYADKVDAEGREFIAFARDGAVRMDRMVVDLLDYSRVGRGDTPAAPVNLAEAVAAARTLLAVALAEAGAELEVGSLPVVSGWAVDLIRLFQNLIGNALKYRASDRAPRIGVSAESSDGQVTVSVADNGIGIAPEHSERIFAVFQRLHTREQYDGTGIGLAVCRKVVERHGGRIWVESTPGAGSVFRFTLPLA